MAKIINNNNRNWREYLHDIGYSGILKNMPTILFVTFFALFSIWINHQSESTIRQINKLSVELKELRWKHIDETSKWMFLTKESELAKKASEQGLQVLLNPPQRIELNNNNEKKIKN
ncbi:MAG: hypothetical protein KA275_05525 [Chitinophagaceae bacterium]|nr:hypothetical protein [Chitinophagaceae bacterium]